MKRTLDLTYDEIIIGADLSALYYSYVKKIPLIYLRKLKPNKFDSDSIKWDQTMFFLSLHNLIPFADNLQTIRFENDNCLKLITKENFISTINFKECIVSDDYNIVGLNFTQKFESKNNLVLDWFRLDNMATHDLTVIHNEDNFLKKIQFYNSQRLKNFPKNKDAVGFSYITNQEMTSGDYSETVSRLFLSRILKQNKLLGKYNKNISVKLINREHFSLEKNQYDGLPKNVKILNEAPQEILKLEKKQDTYFEYLERLVNGRQINN